MNNKDDETVALKNLLRCSSQEDEWCEPSVMVSSWDEMSSWKSVVPMCTYVKTKRKKERTSCKSKKKSSCVKQPSEETSASSDHHRRIYSSAGCGGRFKNLAYVSTDVLSYSSPTSRDIVDNKTFEYLDREHYRHLSDFLLRQRSRNILDSYTQRMEDIDMANDRMHNADDGKEKKRFERKDLSCMDQMRLANIKLSLRKSLITDPRNLRRNFNPVFKRTRCRTIRCEKKRTENLGTITI